MAHIMLSDVATLLTYFQTPSSGNGPVVHLPTDAASYVKVILRWGHLLAGITWIGLLYFFNVVNVPFQKQLDQPTKGKVIPALMPNAMWYFRWGAMITVLIGLAYYGSFLLGPDAHNGGESSLAVLGIWFAIILVTYTIIFFVTKPEGPLNNGTILAVLVAIVVILMSVVIVLVFGRFRGMGNETVSISIGGGLGIIMLANVWSIIWPAQRRIIAWTKANADGAAAMPPELMKYSRRAFLASRTNAWLSLPMLFFMAVSHNFTMFGR